MKKLLICLLSACLPFVSGTVLTACDNNEETESDNVFEVKSVFPEKVIEGQKITITGIGLENVGAVVFPGNITVNDITRVGSDYLTVITPGGLPADGGVITVKAGEQSAVSPQSLSVGKPDPQRAAPLDKEIKINECVEVYGNDLEFIEKAYFPGKEGNVISVDATEFRRKATASLLIYTPMGIKAGPAKIVLEDCSGKKYTLPEVILSEEISGGSSSSNATVIWEGNNVVNTWDDWQYLKTDQFKLENVTLAAGTRIRLTFDNPNGASVCVCDGNWGAPDVDGNGKNTVWVEAGTTTLEFGMSQGMVDTFNSGTGIIIGGTGFTLKKIEIMQD